MKFFLDTANVKEIREGQAMGVLDGVTTNPSLVAKEGQPFKDSIIEICNVVNGPVSVEVTATDLDGMLEQGRTYAKWQDLGVRRIDGAAFGRSGDEARLWLPERGGPAFLLGQNYFAVRSYNPADSYTLALLHLGDLIKGLPDFQQQFPGGERRMTVAELQEIQKKLTAMGFDTQGTDGRVGPDTMRAVRAFQQKYGITPADGYPGLKVLARVRQG